MIGLRSGRAALAALRFGGATGLLTVALLSGGCHKPETEDDSAPPKPISVAFTGETDARLIGDWKSKDGSSELDLAKDGTLHLSASSPGRPGASSKMTGEWRVDGDRLLLQYTIGDGSVQTVGYTMKVSGDAMTLSTKLPKQSTSYTRR